MFQALWLYNVGAPHHNVIQADMFREGMRVALLVCSVVGLVSFLLYKLYITGSETQAELLQLQSATFAPIVHP